jgi:hypothetical protein
MWIPESLPGASSSQPDHQADIEETDSDNIDRDFSYWRSIGTVAPSVEHRVWEPDGRRVGRRSELSGGFFQTAAQQVEVD